jgi:hypothetical protein
VSKIVFVCDYLKCNYNKDINNQIMLLYINGERITSAYIAKQYMDGYGTYPWIRDNMVSYTVFENHKYDEETTIALLHDRLQQGGLDRSPLKAAGHVWNGEHGIHKIREVCVYNLATHVQITTGETVHHIIAPYHPRARDKTYWPAVVGRLVSHPEVLDLLEYDSGTEFSMPDFWTQFPRVLVVAPAPVFVQAAEDAPAPVLVQVAEDAPAPVLVQVAEDAPAPVLVQVAEEASVPVIPQVVADPAVGDKRPRDDDDLVTGDAPVEGE